jgi:predicted chitinase
MNLATKYKTVFNKYNVNTKLRQAHFYFKIGHESGFQLKKGRFVILQ